MLFHFCTTAKCDQCNIQKIHTHKHTNTSMCAMCLSVPFLLANSCNESRFTLKIERRKRNAFGIVQTLHSLSLPTGHQAKSFRCIFLSVRHSRISHGAEKLFPQLSVDVYIYMQYKKLDAF